MYAFVFLYECVCVCVCVCVRAGVYFLLSVLLYRFTKLRTFKFSRSWMSKASSGHILLTFCHRHMELSDRSVLHITAIPVHVPITESLVFSTDLPLFTEALSVVEAEQKIKQALAIRRFGHMNLSPVYASCRSCGFDFTSVTMQAAQTS